MSLFQKAVKHGAKLRLALVGPSGSGKTYSSLAIASHLGERIAFIDTERGSARKYSDTFTFDVLELTSFAVQNFIAGIQDAAANGYDVLVIDSLSHAWSGKDGILEFVDERTAASKAKNAYTSGWRDATPLHNRLVDAILSADIHVIACMRSKTEYVLQDDGRGKKVPTKIGMQPIQREGMEFEFDVVADMDLDHNLIVSKTRCAALDQKLFNRPGADLAAVLNDWLSGEPAPAPPVPTPVPQKGYPVLESDIEWQQTYNRLVRRVNWMREQNLNGYGDVDVIRKDVHALTGVEKLADADMLGLRRFDDHIMGVVGFTDTPFDNVAADAPSPVKERPSGDIKDLQTEVRALLKRLVDADIDGYGASKRLSNSINDHLHVKKVVDCVDSEALAAYVQHLRAKLDGDSVEVAV